MTTETPKEQALRELKEKVNQDYDSGVPAELIKRRYHLTDSEFDDMVGGPTEEDDDTGRSETTGY